MATITLKGNKVETSGQLPAVGTTAPDFTLVDAALEERSLADLSGTKVLNIFPSIDTGVCAASVRRFTKEASGLVGVVVANISADLPFAAKRFCAAEGIETAVTLSAFRSEFGKAYGVEMTTGPMRGLLSRAVIVLDANNRVTYAEQVPEIVQEPNYEAALAAARS